MIRRKHVTKEDKMDQDFRDVATYVDKTRTEFPFKQEKDTNTKAHFDDKPIKETIFQENSSYLNDKCSYIKNSKTTQAIINLLKITQPRVKHRCLLTKTKTCARVECIVGLYL